MGRAERARCDWAGNAAGRQRTHAHSLVAKRQRQSIAPGTLSAAAADHSEHLSTATLVNRCCAENPVNGAARMRDWAVHFSFFGHGLAPPMAEPGTMAEPAHSEPPQMPPLVPR